MITWVVIGAVFIVFVWLGIMFLMPKKPAQEKQKASQKADHKDDDVKVEAPLIESVLHTGKVKCACVYLLGNQPVLDFTTIPTPIGEAYSFDPSCPVSGEAYLVRMDADGKILDYDPREVPYDLMESPEVAYWATHWPVVKDVFGILIPALRNPTTLNGRLARLRP